MVFTGFTDGTLMAFDDTTLETLWKINVGVGFNAPPMTFEVNGKQYVVVAVGGAGYPAELLAYRLPN